MRADEGGVNCAVGVPMPATDPRLGALADNGGPTRTSALLPRSPALDAGSVSSCPGHDQRGVRRPAGERCDIGAFEKAHTRRTWR